MKPYLIDIPVALIFFNRPDTFKKVFEAVASARPSKLFLIQDGAREGKTGELEKVKRCRDLISIDWECEVHEDFSVRNLGCGLRIYTGLTKAFEVVDRLVIVEDDIVIGEDMLPFCAEMLEKYKNDERIGVISGMNHLWEYNRTPYSYFFSMKGGAIWGWATWRRVWNSIDWNLECADNDYLMSTLEANTLPQMNGKALARRTKAKKESMRKGEKQTSWSTQFDITTCKLQSRMNLIPVKNLTSNIGLMGEHTSVADLSLIPKGLRKIYFAPTYKLKWPLKHPQYVIDDVIYSNMQNNVMTGGFAGKYYRFFEVLIYKLFSMFKGK